MTDDLSAGLEEVRENIAAAFDAVRDLAAEIRPLTGAVHRVAAQIADMEEAEGALGGTTFRVALERIEQRLAAVQHGVAESMSALAKALDERLDELSERPAPASASPTDPALPPSVSSSLAAINRRLEGVGRVGPVLTDLAAWMSGVATRQDKIEAELARLADEVQSYRRRLQLAARPPLLSEEQADSIINKLLDGLADLAAQQRARQPAQLESSAPADPPPAEPSARRRRR